jgi:hypothetical protein
MTTLLSLLSAVALAQPSDSIVDLIQDHHHRAELSDRLMGSSLRNLLHPKRDNNDVLFFFQPQFSFSAGDYQPYNNDGDTLTGLLSTRLGGTVGFTKNDWIVSFSDTSVGLDIVPLDASLANLEFTAGLDKKHFFIGFSQRSRWLGPGRHGSLSVTDNATPLPAFEVGGDWKFGGILNRMGRFGAELNVGWMPGEREDVDNPGWLLMDFRWAPVPMLEMGLTRNAVFGGWEDGVLRPIDPLQLLIPSEPHVYGDTEQVLADTDERAALDIRLTIPLSKWLLIDYLDLYMQQGGEDVIARNIGPIPVPALAGIANLYGLEIAKAPFWANIEFALLEDDLYRWYTGHRVYHDGWTNDDRSLGYPSGGDSRRLVGSAGIGPWHNHALVLTADSTTNTYIADVLNDHLFSFPNQQKRDALSLGVTRFYGLETYLTAEYTTATVRNEQGIPGQDAQEHLFWVRWQGQTHIK